jgi:predicted nucleic acid-binding protein
MDPKLLPDRCLIDTGVLIRALRQQQDANTVDCAAFVEAMVMAEKTVLIAAPTLAEVLRSKPETTVPATRHVVVVPFDRRTAELLGEKMPWTQYAENILTFSKQVLAHKLDLPVIWEIVFNNYTSNLGVANAYNSIRSELLDICWKHCQTYPAYFAPLNNNATATSKRAFAELYMSDVKDFHSAGKVAAALGIPMYRLTQSSRYTMPDGSTINLPKANYEVALGEIDNLVDRIQ